MPEFDKRLSLRKLEVFCAVVDLGGITRAAEHLFLAQPVVSGHIQSLEERVGVRLFERDGRQLRLTDSGRRVYDWASETLAGTRELSRELDGLESGERGSIAIAAEMGIGSYLLPHLLVEFLRTRPEAQISVDICNPDSAIAAAESGTCDMAIVGAEAPPRRGPLDWEPLGRAEIVLVTAPHGQPRASAVALSEIEVLPFVVSATGDFRRAVVDQQLLKAGVEPRNVRIRLGHSEAIKRAVQSGLGASLLLRVAVRDENKRGALREGPIKDAQLSIPLFLIRRT